MKVPFLLYKIYSYVINETYIYYNSERGSNKRLDKKWSLLLWNQDFYKLYT